MTNPNSALTAPDWTPDPIESDPIAPALLDALAALNTRVLTARASLDETTRRYDYARKHLTPEQAAKARDERRSAWARLTEAQECLAAVERFR